MGKVDVSIVGIVPCVHQLGWHGAWSGEVVVVIVWMKHILAIGYAAPFLVAIFAHVERSISLVLCALIIEIREPLQRLGR